MKSFHLPDISLSWQSGDQEFRRMSNILRNNDKGPVAALCTLTYNYRCLISDLNMFDLCGEEECNDGNWRCYNKFCPLICN